MTSVRETPASTPERLEVDMMVDADQASVWRALTDADGLTSWWADEAGVPGRRARPDGGVHLELGSRTRRTRPNRADRADPIGRVRTVDPCRGPTW